ncbi:FluG domain-containing protein [Apiospora rasikravindrae]|uniref:FluG domain-containing protein n=1 Tax=Apiospora rasikravindrae TaxID=990691 RepID=A0ABR1SCB1_9PEZI
MVPKQVWESLPPDPEIEALKQRREILKDGRYRYKGQENEEEIRVLSGSIRTKQAQRVSNVEEQYRQYFFYNRPTWDIERQAAGEEELVELEEAWQPEIDLQISERAELAEAFLFQPEVPTFEDMLESCIHAVDVMFRLCQKRETPRRTRIHKRAQVQPNITDATPPDPHIFPLLMLKTQCPRCIGDGRLSYQERTFTYSRPAVMNDHFERAHVREIRDLEHDKLIFCEHPTCVEEGVKLDDFDHFRNHVQTVHGVWLRPRTSVG